MQYQIVILPGDGVGPEVIAQGKKVMIAAAKVYGLDFNLEEIPCGGGYYLKHEKEWADGSFEKCRSADAILLGAVGQPDTKNPNKSVLRADGELAGYEQVIGLRKKLELYANVRPIKLYPGVKHNISGTFSQVWKPENVDLVIVRENIEDLYSGVTRTTPEGSVTDCVITKRGAERVIKYSFELARKRSGRPKDGKRIVTCIDKSNAVGAHRFFRKVYNEVAAQYPDIERDYAYVDAFAQWLIKNPENYDVCVVPNFPGDIVTDLGAVLQGGMGMAAGGNIGDSHAMFEPIHGSAPKYTGQDKVNPIATVQAVVMMFGWLGERKNDNKLKEAAIAVEGAVKRVILNGDLTYDLGGQSKTSQVGDAIVNEVIKSQK